MMRKKRKRLLRRASSIEDLILAHLLTEMLQKPAQPLAKVVKNAKISHPVVMDYSRRLRVVEKQRKYRRASQLYADRGLFQIQLKLTLN